MKFCQPQMSSIDRKRVSRATETSIYNESCLIAKNQLNLTNKTPLPILSQSEHRLQPMVHTSHCQHQSAPIDSCAIMSDKNSTKRLHSIDLRSHSCAILHPRSTIMYRRALAPSSKQTLLLHRRRLYSANLIVALTVAACIFILRTQADSTLPEPSIQSTSANQDVNQNSNDRIDTSNNGKSVASSVSPSASSSSSSSSTSSIVASLSSAVASAAAAAAVAAAQNSLSGGDARSLLSGSNNVSPASGGQSSKQHAQRSSSGGLHLALKFADAIPEVPYNILHNMKKLDHAAPFYNVPNKLSGSTKESGQNFISSAITASGGLGGATEQLTALFRSPLWKRIADGYGEFTSEFRSLFKPPSPMPMKGSTSSTSKLLRDISVPAILMLLASTISSDWRPVRTRRKSINPALELPPMIQQHHHQQYPLSNEFMNTGMGYGSLNNFGLQNNNNYDLIAQNSYQQNINQMPKSNVGDIPSLQTSESASKPNWLASPSSHQQPPVANNHNQNHNYLEPQQQLAVQTSSQSQQQPPQQLYKSLRRSGDQDDQVYHDQQKDSVESVSSSTVQDQRAISSSSSATARSLFGSLTSGFAKTSPDKLINKIFDANSVNDGVSHRMMSLLFNQAKNSPIKRDQLGDKQRYTLIGLEDNHSASFTNANKQKLSTPSSKPILSAMTHAISSMLNAHPSESGYTFNEQNSLHRQQQPQAIGIVEQRDFSQLSQYLPQSWREVVKRTVTNVQQQASSQWKSIEGQLANWVQDKIKSTISSVPSASSSSTSSNTLAAPAPVSNLLASVGSTAMNILGLKGSQGQNSSASSTPVAASSVGGTSSGSASVANGHRDSVTTPVSLKNKPEKPAGGAHPKGALAGMADMLLNTLTNRSSAPQTALSASTTDSNGDQAKQVNSVGVADATSSLSSVQSQYPVLTGSQASSSSDKASLSNGQSPVVATPDSIQAAIVAPSP